MNHLSDEQLSALLDDALPPAERAACDAHLAGCDACRARLAEASALDASLGKALTHDPGERYFADFADRVAKRIAAGEASPVQGPRRTSIWAWLTSPRGLALAGSTAALLVTAGIAWMRFHNEQDVARALREAGPAPAATRASKQAAPGANDELSPPAASTPAAPSSGERRDGAAPPRDLARMQEVRTLPNGEQVPVSRQREQATGNAPVAPATGSAIAQMKRRSIAPATEGGATSESAPREEAPRAKDAEAGATASQKLAAPAVEPQRFAAPPAPAAAPHTSGSLTTDTSRGQSFSAWGATKSLYKSGAANELKSDAGKGLTATCGKVRDSRGRVVAGAAITAVRNGVRTARTDSEGSFCIDGLAAGDTLTVMHVGFDPYTVVMTPMTSLAITLEPVGTLGPNATMLTGKAPAPSPSFSGALNTHVSDSATAPTPDPYAGLSSGIRQLVRDARQATAVARREHTAPAFENAAKQWAAVMGQVAQANGAPAHDAGFQHVAALREAYKIESTSDRARRLGSAMAAFLATAPDTLPERATVARWQAELKAPPGR